MFTFVPQAFIILTTVSNTFSRGSTSCLVITQFIQLAFLRLLGRGVRQLTGDEWSNLQMVKHIWL